MNILVAIFIIFFVIFLNYIRYMDMLYPPVIQGGLWILVLLMYYVYTDKFMPLSDTMCFIITIGIINFSFGSYISTFKYKPKKKFIFFKNIKEKDIILNLVFWIPIIVLPFFLYKAYSIGTSGISEDYFFKIELN